MTTRAVIGCSQWRDYSVPLPISALLWREVVGHEPLALLVEDETFWRKEHKRCNLVLNALDRFQIDRHFIGHIDGVEHATVAQSCRQHAAALKLDENTWLMMSDADLWPLKRDFYHQHENSGKEITLYYANGDHYQSYPTCHQTMQVKTWRKVMGINPDFGLRNTLEVYFKNHLPKDAFAVWMLDQHCSSKLIDLYAGGRSNLNLIERKGHPPMDRLDRGIRELWNGSFNKDQWTDAHILKAPEENWSKLRPIVEVLLPKHLDYFDAYMKECLS